MAANDWNEFEKFCGGEVWNLNLSWYTDHPDVTKCFQDTVLVLTECALLWLISIFYIFYLARLDSSLSVIRSCHYVLKLVCCLFLILVSTASFTKGMLNFTMGHYTYAAVFVSPLTQVITFVLVMCIIYMEQQKAFVTSGVLFIFFLVLVVAGIVSLYSYIYHQMKGELVDIIDMILYVIYFTLCLVELLLLSFADNSQFEHTHSDKLCPERKSSFLSRITYWWVNSLVWSGYKQPLSEGDLWDPNSYDCADHTSRLLEHEWQRELARCHWPGQRTANSSVPAHQTVHVIDVESAHTSDDTPLLNGSIVTHGCEAEVEVRGACKQKSPSLLRTVLWVFGPTLAQGHLCKLIGDVMIFCGPLLQGLLVEFTVNESIEQWKGYLYAVLMFASAVFNSLMLQMLYQMSCKVGMRVKAAVVAMVYKKALTMSNEARRTTTVGEIVNLMSVDAERLRDVSTYLWMIWSCPLQIGVAIFLLYNVVGVSVFAGLGVMVVLLPVNMVLAHIRSNLETEVMRLKDLRMKLMNEVLAGIKVIKLYAWELSFQEKVISIRQQELKAVRKCAYLDAVGTFTWTCAPFLVTLATFAMYVLLGGVLDASRAFTALSLFNILRFPMSVLPMMISYVVTACVSVNRLNHYLQTPDIDTSFVKHDPSAAYPILMENGSFAWSTKKNDRPTLKRINLKIPDGKLVAVVGPVGAGKSSLISAILGEMETLSGSVTVRGSIAYVSQQAWIQNMSLRDNILFVSPYDEHRYNTVLDACALRPDLEILPAGDRTEIGENGINLSGGQKQRVSLARAVYQNCDIYLFDDPLSAVDSHVGRQLFNDVIGNSGLLGTKTRVLVTHGIHWLPFVDLVVDVQDGCLSEVGSYQDLMSHNKAFAQFLRTHLLSEENEDDPEIMKIRSDILSRVSSLIDVDDDDDAIVGSPPQSGASASHQHLHDKESRQSVSHCDQKSVIKEESRVSCGERLIEDEGGEVGEVRWSVYLAYCRALGIAMSVVLLLFFALFEASSLLSNLWLTKWTDDAVLQNSSLSNTTTFVFHRDFYLGVYGGFGVLQAIFLLIFALLNASRSVAAAGTLHNSMLAAILRSALVFFERTPMGRIMNRFSRDIDTVDEVLADILESWMISAFGVLSTVIVLCYAMPIFIAIVIPLGVFYYFAQKFYVSTSRQLRRLEAKTRSPIYIHFSETITGASTIRAFGVQNQFTDMNNLKVDHNLVFYYANISANRWLGFRLEFVGAIIVFFAAIFAVIGRGVLSGSIVGLAISYALQVTDSLNWLVRMTSDLETNMVSVERIKEYVETPSEAAWHIEDTSPSENWPNAGAVTFNQYATRYRSCLDLVLKNINIHIQPGEKIGIVGRTGAGKSSLTLALFRIIEATAGEIIIDNLQISTLGLHQLRSRITILPQDPVMFSGSLRMNLDPFGQHSDDELWQVLEHAHLKSFVESLMMGLDHECGEGGQNFSVGQRQLVCLARALLRKTQILVLDEATAAVDIETDNVIQTTIREQFANCTVLTIAHRLNTILDCDRIMVLKAGEIVEVDTPQTLLSNSGSQFYAMAKDAGLVS